MVFAQTNVEQLTFFTYGLLAFEVILTLACVPLLLKVSQWEETLRVHTARLLRDVKQARLQMEQAKINVKQVNFSFITLSSLQALAPSLMRKGPLRTILPILMRFI
jgi:hypothetical protein